jgi:uncharacterized protein
VSEPTRGPERRSRTDSRPASQAAPARARGRGRELRTLALVAGLGLLAVGFALVALGLATGGRSRTGSAEPATPATAAGAARTVTYRLEPADGPAVPVRLEVAANAAARAVGLMGRERLAPGSGMVFLYPADTTASFWMKNTLVPLSIAFVAADGRVVSTTEMTPCRADPCPTYPPAGAYRYAVELSAGAFRAAGVGAGDRVVPENPAELPQAA